MSRRKRTYKREVIPDPVFKDLVVAKFVNKMMLRGQKATAQRMFYGAMDEIKVVRSIRPVFFHIIDLENAVWWDERWLCSRNIHADDFRVGILVRHVHGPYPGAGS